MGIVTLIIALATMSSAAPAPQPGKTVKISHTRYGDILVDGKGRTLYLFTKERTSNARCYGDCATAWPPFLTSGAPRAGKRVDARKLGTTKRRNGKRQVTYNGHPLYYYVADTR